MHLILARRFPASDGANNCKPTFIPRGKHEVERVKDPSGATKRYWLVLKGTSIGQHETYWRSSAQRRSSGVKIDEPLFQGTVHHTGDSCGRMPPINSDRSPRQRFAKWLFPGSMSDGLWATSGYQFSTVSIKKEIWLSTSGPVRQYPVFFVYDGLDYSKTIPGAGCRVNKKPYRRLGWALRRAEKHFVEAYLTGKWLQTDESDRRCSR